MKVKPIVFSALAVTFGCTALAQEQEQGQVSRFATANSLPDEKVHRIRIMEDDAQNYMVSKIYELQHQKANDIVPFIIGSIKRYANNSNADRINYSAGKKQYVTVTCPIPMMPYVDDMIAKLDRPSDLDVYGSGIKGTGIIRNVFVPQYRSAKTMRDIMVDTGISSEATEGPRQDAVVDYDEKTGIIYWKDSINKDKDLTKYLAWLDRPVPQMSVSVNVYEVRESDLMDLGIDYLSWKNGPGMNLFDAGAKFLENSAWTNHFGVYGFFAFAPAFDFSFIRMLQQNGKAQLASSMKVTVVNGHNSTISFTPNYQNLKKDSKFASSVASSSNDKLTLTIKSPVISIMGMPDKDGNLGFTAADYAQQIGNLNFSYDLNMRNVVERNNLGDELFNDASFSSTATVQTGNERMLTHYVRTVDVDQTIGVPFLCEVPVLKYIFGTTTKTQSKNYYFVSITTEMIHPDTDIAQISGKLLSVSELVNMKGK